MNNISNLLNKLNLSCYSHETAHSQETFDALNREIVDMLRHLWEYDGQEIVDLNEDSIENEIDNRNEREQFVDEHLRMEVENVDTKENLLEFLKSYKQFFNQSVRMNHRANLLKKDSIGEDLQDEQQAIEIESHSENEHVEFSNGNWEHRALLRFDHLEQALGQLNTNSFNELLKDLPNNIIVTSLPIELFKNDEFKVEFEKKFKSIDANCKFSYLRVFRRCSVQFENPISAYIARFELNNYLMMNNYRLRVYLTKPIKLKNTRRNLEPPENEKSFLISPPSSPPIGWEQSHEDPPNTHVVNLDLLAALTKLNPHEPCELFKSHADHIPTIIIHPCPDVELDHDPTVKRKFIPTRRPPNYC
jgi:hypothetical protein